MGPATGLRRDRRVGILKDRAAIRAVEALRPPAPPRY
jgi:hypothetical protein